VFYLRRHPREDFDVVITQQSSKIDKERTFFEAHVIVDTPACLATLACSKWKLGVGEAWEALLVSLRKDLVGKMSKLRIIDA